MAGKGLTSKQEAYVRALLKPGATQRTAYREAYPAARKWKDSAVDAQASKCLAIHKVRQRYEELQAEVATGVIYDRRRMIADLTEIVDIGLTHIRQTREHTENFTEKSSRELADLPRGASTVISAIEKLDKLLGLSETGDDGKVTVIDDV